MTDAYISGDGKYRYWLVRSWDTKKKHIIFIGLNPSNADANRNDPTITRLINYTKSWGYGGFYMLNLYSYITPDSSSLKNIKMIKGKEITLFSNIEGIMGNMDIDKIILMWGNNSPPWRKAWVTRVLSYLEVEHGEKTYCFIKLKNGNPGHPLYLKSNIEPIKYFN